MCIAHRLLLSTSEISDATASMPSPGYFALQHRVAPPRKAYSLTSSAFLESGTPCPFLLFTPVFRGSLLFSSCMLNTALAIGFRLLLFTKGSGSVRCLPQWGRWREAPEGLTDRTKPSHSARWRAVTPCVSTAKRKRALKGCGGKQESVSHCGTSRQNWNMSNSYIY